jgi:hypothetical protein
MLTRAPESHSNWSFTAWNLPPSKFLPHADRISVALQKPKVAQVVAAVFTAAVMLAAPAFAKEEVTDKVRNAVCSANPTAKMCLRGSFARSQGQ